MFKCAQNGKIKLECKRSNSLESETRRRLGLEAQRRGIATTSLGTLAK